MVSLITTLANSYCLKQISDKRERKAKSTKRSIISSISPVDIKGWRTPTQRYDLMKQCQQTSKWSDCETWFYKQTKLYIFAMNELEC